MPSATSRARATSGSTATRRRTWWPQLGKRATATTRPGTSSGSKLAFDAKGRLKSVALEDGTAVTYRYDCTGRRVVKESRGPKGDHKTVYVDSASEERDGQAIDYVMAGRTRLARLGGKEPVQVAAAGVLARVPPVLTTLAAALLALALLFGLARAQVPARSAAALGSVCSFLALTTSGCNCGHSAGTAAPIPATHYHGDHLGGTTLLAAQDESIAAEIAYDPAGPGSSGPPRPTRSPGRSTSPTPGSTTTRRASTIPCWRGFSHRTPGGVRTREGDRGGRPVQRTVSDAANERLSESYTYYDGEPFKGLGLGSRYSRKLRSRRPWAALESSSSARSSASTARASAPARSPRISFSIRPRPVQRRAARPRLRERRARWDRR